ncbi:MAG: UDP-glucose/GDP-mannose dehydrogenase family protein, partial [Leptolyngbyaceae cyanobacterium CRU_2_3]|nr:UDP-glucose/GDP-mannose dehydrogenase family protein [Leptolyngbyaceae cyanobacterium CRU_2_3]
ETYGQDFQLLQNVIQINVDQVDHFVDRIAKRLGGFEGKTVGLLGLTFKPDTDDLRDAPALDLIEQLHRLGARVKGYDPLVSQSGMRHGLSNVLVETDAERLADGCDALVLVTDWKQFLSLDYEGMAKLMVNPVIIDGRNFLDQAALESAGFRYVGIGRQG